MLGEVIGLLKEKKLKIYVDGTLGAGGHAEAVLEKHPEIEQFIGIDQDTQALEIAKERLKRWGEKCKFYHGNFAEVIPKLDGQIDGMLLDLGVSSMQLDRAERGFSFSKEGPLDMRMDQTRGISAAEWVNTAPEAELARVMKEYGEERFAKRMARALVEERSKAPIERTGRLAHILKEANPAWEKGKHPATRAFQGIRIHINSELADLEAVLDQALEALQIGGRLVVISFHSLEDRLVKRFIRRHEKGDPVPRGVPLMESQLNKRLKSRSKAVKADAAELGRNVRSRSAVMRIAEKIA